MDEKFVLTIIEKFNAAAITEIEFTDGAKRLLLRKGSAGTSAAAVAAAPVPAGKETAEEQSVRLGISAGAAKDASGGGDLITSPIVGTFYSAPSPDAPPFVKTGSKVKAGDTLCILEAMKMMNHLEAEFDCEIVEVHAASGELVEYGQNLFTVKKN